MGKIRVGIGRKLCVFYLNKSTIGIVLLVHFDGKTNFNRSLRYAFVPRNS